MSCSRLTRDDYELVDAALTFLTTVAAPADYPWARGIEWEIVHRAFGGDPTDLTEHERRVIAQIVDVFVVDRDDCNPHGIARQTVS